MTHAVVTGWGKCLPPAVLSNADLATFLDTGDEWILARTGIRERRIAHVGLTELAQVAALRALAAAGREPGDIELIVFGSTSFDEQAPNQASGLQQVLGAQRAAAMDVNTACTSFLYAWSTANALIRSGAVRNALVVGGEVISRFMDWSNRNVAVLFGDGCAAVVLEATDEEAGLLGERLGCDTGGRQALVIRGMGARYADFTRRLGVTEWIFDGPEIFRRAVTGMAQAAGEVLAAHGMTAADVDLVVPHQANLRIIEAVTARLGVPAGRTFVNVQRYGNMSAATVAVALVEALEAGSVKPGAMLLLPAFGAGLTWCAHLARWGGRVTPLRSSSAELPPAQCSGLELVQALRAQRAAATAS
ncbi:MAG TPA: beta-ketoacyl-ACP synthase 3 [Steroidobacteraceae bacterium]|nr:beta-ketoacyl-ACP synthase 3 [Steroidobacteraceae bacterium]